MTGQRFMRKHRLANDEERAAGIERVFYDIPYPTYPCEVCGAEHQVEQKYDEDGNVCGYFTDCGWHGKTDVPKKDEKPIKAFFATTELQPGELENEDD